jgi:hypothetical protein
MQGGHVYKKEKEKEKGIEWNGRSEVAESIQDDNME